MFFLTVRNYEELLTLVEESLDSKLDIFPDTRGTAKLIVDTHYGYLVII